MLTFESIADCRDAIMAFRFGKLDTLPSEWAQNRLKALASSPSPVDQIVGTMELLYGQRAHLDAAGKQMVGALAGFAAANAWHGLLENDRGSKIVLAMARDSGADPIPGYTYPDPADDPAPRQDAIEPAPPAALPTPTA